MAGGTFTTMNKRRPGAYINLKAPQTTIPSAESTRGVVFFVAGESLGWGADGIIKLTAASNFLKLLGVDPYVDNPDLSNDVKLTLSGLRETLKAAKEVLFYNINSGTQATGSDEKLPWTVRAVYGGARGNDITLQLVRDPVETEKVIVSTYFGSQLADKQVLTEAGQVQNNDFIEFIKKDAGDDGKALFDALEATTTVQLTGGTTADKQEVDTDALVNAMEVQDFNTMVAAGQEVSAHIHQLLISTAKRLRDEEGQKVVAVVPDGTGIDPDNEGVIVVANGVVLANGQKLSVSETCGWVAGAEAAADINKSLTYQAYPDAVDVTERYTNEDTISALEDGKLLFTVQRNHDVVVEQDINSLHTYDADKNQSLSKNRVMRVLDDIANNTKETFSKYFIGKVDNDDAGRQLFKGNRLDYLAYMANKAAVKNVEPDDITVEKGPEIDQVVCHLYVQPIDAMEKLYMTVRI